MKSKKTIKLSAADVRSMIKDLNLIVVSRDHIRSTYNNRPRQLALETERYFRKIKAYKILAKVRGVLSEAYELQSTKAEVLHSEEDAEKVPIWRWKPTKKKK